MRDIDDPAALLLARHVDIAADAVVVHMNCGNGVFGAVAADAAAAGRVILTDRNIVAVESARRTLAAKAVANASANASVLAGHGAYALPRALEADVVAIRIPREKLPQIQLISDAFGVLRVGGRCYIAGATNEGIRSAARILERVFGGADVLAHGSGHRVVAATKRADEPASRDDLDSPYLDASVFREIDVTLRGRAFTLCTRPGVFSWEHLDEATEILAGLMDVRPGESVLDLGCGAGALGVVAAVLSGDGRVCMVDADVEAVRSAACTAAAAGMGNATALASDGAAAVFDERFDVVVTNPPFHAGRSTALDVPQQFIRDAWHVLVPGGRLLLVANRTLPYEREIRRRFGNVQTVHDGVRFKVLGAQR